MAIVRAGFEALTGTPYNKNLTELAVPTKARKHLAFLHRHHGILSAVRSIPEEVLELIFYYTLLMTSRDHWSSGKLSCLTQVSRRWRSAAMSSPRLWAQLGSIVFKGRTARQERNRYQMLKLHLERSANHPISFMFSVQTVDPTLTKTKEYIPNVAVPLLALLTKHSRQWEDVRLILQNAVLPGLEGIHGNLPMLRKLWVAFGGTEYDATSTLDYFADAPLLRFLKLLVPATNIHLQDQAQFPWSQLERYEEEAGQEIGFGDVLFTSTNLKALSYRTRMSEYQSIPAIDPGQFRQETLTKLHLDVQFPGEMATSPLDILRNTSLPSLRDLSVICGHAPNLLNDVCALILSSSCSLRHLKIIGSDTTGGRLSRILSLCPELIQLCVNYLPVVDIQRLGDAESPCVPVPLLRELVQHRFPIEVAIVPPLNHRAFGAMARARERLYREKVVSRMDIIIKEIDRWDHFESHPRARSILPELEAFPLLAIGDFGPSEEFRSSLLDYIALRAWEGVLRKQTSYHRFREKLQLAYYYSNPSALNRVLKEIESYSIEGSDLTLLYRTDIPALLNKLSSMASSTVPGDRFYHFVERAGKLKERWKPVFVADSSRHWVIQNDTTIEYVYSDDERREGDQGWSIAVGIDRFDLGR